MADSDPQHEQNSTPPADATAPARGLGAARLMKLKASEATVDALAVDSLSIDHLPGRLPAKALVFSGMALAAAATASLLLPPSASEVSALVWLLAIVPAFLFAYYKGWSGATVALVAAMALLVVLEIGFSVLQRGEVAWWLVGVVTVVLISVSMGAGILSEGHRRKTAEALKLAYADPLTGLPNRRVLKMFLSREFAASVRGRPCAIVLLDIDRFKSINDNEGHQAGDDVLQAVAEALETNTRASDISGRVGGDEFLTLLPGTGVHGARIFAERVLESVADRFESAGMPVTVSGGVAVSNSHTKDEYDLMQAADIALYSAKRAGGNRVVVAGPHPVEEVQPTSVAS